MTYSPKSKRTPVTGQSEASEGHCERNEQYYHQPHCNTPSFVKPFTKGVSCSCRHIEVVVLKSPESVGAE
jgi:hypothetical protein